MDIWLLKWGSNSFECAYLQTPYPWVDDTYSLQISVYFKSRFLFFKTKYKSGLSETISGKNLNFSQGK